MIGGSSTGDSSGAVRSLVVARNLLLLRGFWPDSGALPLAALPAAAVAVSALRLPCFCRKRGSFDGGFSEGDPFVLLLDIGEREICVEIKISWMERNGATYAGISNAETLILRENVSACGYSCHLAPYRPQTSLPATQHPPRVSRTRIQR